MNRKMLIPLLLVFLSGLVVSPLYGAVRPWDLDKEHSNFYFSVDHIYAKVQGRFTDFDGELLFDPDNLKGNKFSIEIKVKSVDTGISKRDRHLLSADFFDASEYPQITYIGDKFTKTGANSYEVTGKLTIKGISTELILPLTYLGTRDHPFVSGMEVAGFNGRLTIDRLAFKVGSGKYYTMGAVGKDVDILVTIEAMRKKES